MAKKQLGVTLENSFHERSHCHMHNRNETLVGPWVQKPISMTQPPSGLLVAQWFEYPAQVTEVVG